MYSVCWVYFFYSKKRSWYRIVVGEAGQYGEIIRQLPRRIHDVWTASTVDQSAAIPGPAPAAARWCKRTTSLPVRLRPHRTIQVIAPIPPSPLSFHLSFTSFLCMFTIMHLWVFKAVLPVFQLHNAILKKIRNFWYNCVLFLNLQPPVYRKRTLRAPPEASPIILHITVPDIIRPLRWTLLCATTRQYYTQSLIMYFILLFSHSLTGCLQRK